MKLNTILEPVKTTLLGGLVVALPVLLTLFLLRWLFSLLSQMLAPLTRVILSQSTAGARIAEVLAFLLVVAACFFLGLAVRTRLGKWLLSLADRKILGVAPGYTFFKETIRHLLGRQQRPFSQVALIRPWGNGVWMTGFVTDHQSQPDLTTVFAPSALNPTTGLILHLTPDRIRLLEDVGPDEAMRTIISCGAGSSELLRQLDTDLASFGAPQAPAAGLSATKAKDPV